MNPRPDDDHTSGSAIRLLVIVAATVGVFWWGVRTGSAAIPSGPGPRDSTPKRPSIPIPIWSTSTPDGYVVFKRFADLQRYTNESDAFIKQNLPDMMTFPAIAAVLAREQSKALSREEVGQDTEFQAAMSSAEKEYFDATKAIELKSEKCAEELGKKAVKVGEAYDLSDGSIAVIVAFLDEKGRRVVPRKESGYLYPPEGDGTFLDAKVSGDFGIGYVGLSPNVPGDIDAIVVSQGPPEWPVPLTSTSVPVVQQPDPPPEPCEPKNPGTQPLRRLNFRISQLISPGRALARQDGDLNFQVYLLIGIPKSLVDDEAWTGWVFEGDHYTYTTAMESQKTVRTYVVSTNQSPADARIKPRLVTVDGRLTTIMSYEAGPE